MNLNKALLCISLLLSFKLLPAMDTQNVIAESIKKRKAACELNELAKKQNVGMRFACIIYRRPGKTCEEKFVTSDLLKIHLRKDHGMAIQKINKIFAALMIK